MSFGSAQPLSTEVVVDLHEDRVPVIGKHEVKSGHIDAGPITEAEHHCRSLFLQMWPPGMVKPSSPTDVVVELTSANTEVRDGMTAIDHDPQVFASMLHPALDQCGPIGGQSIGVSEKVSRLIYGEDKSAAPSGVPLQHQGIAPRGPVLPEILIQLRRV